MGALAGTPNAWLGEMLRIFNAGDIEGFSELYSANQVAFEGQPSLTFRLEFVKEKLTLLALMNFVFETPAHVSNFDQPHKHWVAFKYLMSHRYLVRSAPSASRQWQHTVE